MCRLLPILMCVVELGLNIVKDVLFIFNDNLLHNSQVYNS